MGHTHQFYHYIYNFTEYNVLAGATVGVCPLGHANCLPTGQALTGVFRTSLASSHLETTSEEDYTPTHTHTYTKQYYTYGGTCYPLLCTNRYTSYDTCGVASLFQNSTVPLCTGSVTINDTSATTSEPIDNGDGTHYHTILRPSNSTQSRLSALGNCAQSHANCKATSFVQYSSASTEETDDDTTDAASPTISVTTLPCLSYSNTSAIIGGQYTSDVDCSIGVEYWYDSNWVTRQSVSATASFTDYVRYFNITGLAKNRTYYFRAFILYNGAYYYGDTLNFTTIGLTIRVPLHTEYNNARYCIRQIEKVALGRSYVDTTGQYVYESRLARNA